MGQHALQPQQTAGQRQATCSAHCHLQHQRAVASWHTHRWLSRLHHSQLGEVRQALHHRRLHRKSTAPRASGHDSSSSSATGLQEAAAKAEDGLKQAGRSAQQALQDAEQQVKEKTRGADDIPDFHLPTAVAMGVCSFEAYNDPGRMEGVAECSENGTQTVYMDRSFLLERVQGVLQVHIRWGAGLPPPQQGDDTEAEQQQSNGSQQEQDGQQAEQQQAEQQSAAAERDTQKKEKEQKAAEGLRPYCTVAAGPSACVSRPATSGRDAQWRETSFLYIREPDTPLVVKAFDANNSDEDPALREPIAQADTPLEPLCDGEVHDLQLDLGPAGLVDLSVQYEPLTEDLLDSLAGRAVNQMITDDWSDDEGGDEPLGSWFPQARGLWQATGGKLFTDDKPRIQSEYANLIAQNNPPDRAEFKEWTQLLERVVSRELTTRSDPFAFIANADTDTELWVYCNKEERDLVFAFRGTSSPKDMITDMSVELQPFSPGEAPAQPSPAELEEDIAGNNKLAPVLEKLRDVENFVGKLSGGRLGKLGLAKWFTSQAQMLYAAEHHEVWVHKGFLVAYRSVASRLLALAEEVTAGDEPWSIYTTGHSMGGALATLFAYELAQQQWDKAPRPDIYMYGFGSPRVGNIPFAEKFDNLVFNAWRISNLNDIVTKVPSLLGFKHVGVEVRLVGDGKVAVKRGTFDEVREGAAFGDLLDRIRDGAFGEDEQLQKEFRELVQAEMETAKALLKGKAIKEHMEDSYCEMVAAAVKAGGDECQAVMVARDVIEEAAKQEGVDVEEAAKRGSGRKQDGSKMQEGDEEAAAAADTDGAGAGGRISNRRGAKAGGIGRGGEGRRRQGDDEEEEESDEEEEDDDDEESVESLDSADSSEAASQASSGDGMTCGDAGGDDGGDSGD